MRLSYATGFRPLAASALQAPVTRMFDMIAASGVGRYKPEASRSGSQQFIEIGDRLIQALLKLYAWCPVQLSFGEVDIGLGLLGIIGRQLAIDHLGSRPGKCQHHLRKLFDRELAGV